VSGYQYRGTGGTMSEEQVAEHLKGVRAKAAARANTGTPSSALATSREARGAEPAPALIQGRVEPGTPPPALKGAVKVSAFPEKSPYPFREIADDGGVWELDPAEFKVKPESIRSSAWSWAKKNGLVVKVVIDGGYVFVQFTGGAQ
jgi:hypothetical protein